VYTPHRTPQAIANEIRKWLAIEHNVPHRQLPTWRNTIIQLAQEIANAIHAGTTP